MILFLNLRIQARFADGTASLFTYQWNLNDPNANSTNPNTATVKDPKHKYTSVGTYPVSLTVTSNRGCMSTISQNFTVNGTVPQSSFIIQSGNEQCSNIDVKITNNSTVDFGKLIRLEVYWDYATDPSKKIVDNTPLPGEIYTNKYPEFYAPATKDYVIRVVAYSGDNCLSTSSQTLTLKATPQLRFDVLPSVCADEPSLQITQVSIVNSLAGNGLYSGKGVS
jgi:PKD repeat protein